jgi:heme oxygenase
MEILSILRGATGAIHARIEELPLCKAILAGEIDGSTYSALLGSLHPLHEAYETEMAASGLQWPATPSRADALRRDLDILDGDTGDTPTVVFEWLDTIRQLEHPAAWAGVGYVMEGSRMGSRVLVKSISQALGLEQRLGKGLDYHLDAGSDPNATWKQVMGCLAAADTDAAARTAIVNAAVATFEAIYALHESACLVPA